MALLSLQTAKAHLRITTDDGDTDIYAKKQQAEAFVLNRCNRTAEGRTMTATWTEATLPGPVQTAMLLVLTYLHEQQLPTDSQGLTTLQAAVDLFLTPDYKAPVLA